MGNACSKQIITGCGPSTAAANDSEMRIARRDDARSEALQCRDAYKPNAKYNG